MASRVASVTADTFSELGRERRQLAALDEEILRGQIDIARIAAPTGAEDRRAEWVARQLTAIGLAPTRDAAGNVIAHARGAYAGAPVVVCAHLDTVFPGDTDLRIRRVGSRIVGPGICDNGRGLAVMVALARIIRGC